MRASLSMRLLGAERIEMELIAKLRHMGRQYSAGQASRGGGQQKHYLEESADLLEEQASSIEVLHGMEADAKARASLLEQHLRAVLEVARTWQPDYASKMDRDTLRYAEECAEGKAPNRY